MDEKRIDQTEEDVSTEDITDEALEAAAGMMMWGAQSFYPATRGCGNC